MTRAGRWARRATCIGALIGLNTNAFAWGPDGHHTVGALADRLLAGTPAQARVGDLLGGLSLQDAAVWADCAKGVDPTRDYAYTAAGRYPECAVFETPQGEAEMIDFVRRNDVNCARKPTEESCHKQYHYSDVAIQRRSYRLGTVGTRPDDVVGAVGAAIAVLQGGTAPPPFDLRSPREALLLLAHWVGDLHQPLHVGAVYLDARGRRVDPDAAGTDPATVLATATRGGNQIVTLAGAGGKRGVNLHRYWDDIPEEDLVGHIDAAWLARAKQVPRTPDDLTTWPATWATGTLRQARSAFAGLRFGAEVDGVWTVTLPAAYTAQSQSIKARQLTQAGARLAQVLEAIWP